MMSGLVLVRSAIFAVLLALSQIASSGYADIVTVLPIQIGNGAGAFANASQQLYLAETNKIWSQAGITFNYLPFTTIISSDFYTVDNQAEVDSLFLLAPGAAMTATTISMWFVSDHFEAYGEANDLGGLNANKIVVSDAVFAEGRLDTIAHEFGHLLGLDHEDVGVGRDYLMRSGDDRITPKTIGNIFPDGTGLDRLTAAQISTARSDVKVTAVPEPSSLALIACAFGAPFLRRRRVASPCRT